jgi:formamidopyrimidine-DNA glycosylase
MPELPEVETVVRSLEPYITGQTIKNAVFYSRFVTRGDFEATACAIEGAKILSIRRVAKHILLQLDRGYLHVHLGMTGKLLWNGKQRTHTRAVLELDNGSLVYEDIRQFGRFEFYSQIPPSTERLGPDALGLSFDAFWSQIHARTSQLKSLLLNQRFIGGLGNIYVDEALHAAGLHPKARANRLSRARAQKLHQAIQEILQLAIRHRGSSISDYVDSEGSRGSFQDLHRVYGKEGKPCLACGTAIRRVVIAQRGTHYCPKCQRT